MKTKVVLVAMYVGKSWCYIYRDENSEEWLIVDEKTVAQVIYSGKDYTWYDQYGNTHKAKSFDTMVRNAVRLYNIASATIGRTKINL